MKITQITDQHLINRIKYFEKVLAEKPELSAYMGDSEYAEDVVDQENRLNDDMADQIVVHIKYMKSEARKRGLVI